MLSCARIRIVAVAAASVGLEEMHCGGSSSTARSDAAARLVIGESDGAHHAGGRVESEVQSVKNGRTPREPTGLICVVFVLAVVTRLVRPPSSCLTPARAPATR